MLKTLRGVFSLGLKAAKLTKRQAEKHLKPLVRRKLISNNDARKLIRSMLKEAKEEGARVKDFVKQEAKRELFKARAAMKVRSQAVKKKRI